VIENEVVIGAPIFGNHPDLLVQAPIGQLDLHVEPRRVLNDTREILAWQAIEYRAIIEALTAMEVPFRVAIGHRKCIAPVVIGWMEEAGLELVECPGLDMKHLTYMRDVAIRPREDLVLVSSEMKDKGIPTIIDGCQVCFSDAGEGGRTHYRDGVVLVNDVVFYDTTFPIDVESNPVLMAAIKKQDIFAVNQLMKGTPAPIDQLRELGLKVGVLPIAIDQIPIPGRCNWYVPGDHIDLVCGLVKGKDGCLHLITDPAPYHHFLGVQNRPLRGPKQTLEVYQRVCDEMGIVLHVPERLSVPASINFVQFDDGRVLMTGGDEEVAGILSDIVPEVRTTEIPIRCIPSWCKAGIRCLIGQWPKGFTEALSTVT